MEVKELMAQLTDIIEEKGNVDIGAEVLGHIHDIELKKLYSDTPIEQYVLEVKA